MGMVRTVTFLILLGVAFVLSPFASARAGEVGVVLLHGKWGHSSPKSPIGKLAAKLESAGFLVETPDMPWSRTRYYAKNYEDSLAEIDAAVQNLKGRGAGTIVVGGHSMGANAALGYGARREGLAGIIAMAPGHIPEIPAVQDHLGHDYQRARAMVEGGQGGSKAGFADRNQGKMKTVTVEAGIYLSWFDPDGPAVMPKNTANLKPGTALLWVVGEQDRMYERGPSYAFDKAPANDKNTYHVVPGGHRVTPIKGAKKIITWLKGL